MSYLRESVILAGEDSPQQALTCTDPAVKNGWVPV